MEMATVMAMVTAMGIAQTEMDRTVTAGTETGMGTRMEMATAITAMEPPCFDRLRLRRLRRLSRGEKFQMDTRTL